MVRGLLLAILVGLASQGLATADESQTIDSRPGNGHQAGVRLGAWINQGESHPEHLTSAQTNSSLETSINKASFYFEGYFAYRLIPQTLLEFSLGIVNRGSVTLHENGRTDVGNLILYPILLQLKLYPITLSNSRFQPYLGVGGGLYYGRRNVQFTNTSLYYYDLDEDSETDFNYALSGGIDWALGESIALDFNLKYMPINFSKGLVTVRDYDAVAVTVGIKYLYSGKKQSSSRRRSR